MARRLLEARAVIANPRRIALGALALTALALCGAARGTPRLEWRRSALPGARGGLRAVAAHPDGVRLAVADARGVLIREEGGWRRLAVRGAVRDLLFDREGALWLAGEHGLLRMDAAGELEDRSPGVGQRDRSLQRLAAAAGWLAAAGEAGAFVSADGRRWIPVRDGVPSGGVDAITLRTLGSGSQSFELWLSTARGLWRSPGRGTDSGPRLAPARRVRLSGRAARRAAVDVALDGGRLLVLGSDWIALEVQAGEPWPSRPLALPPGTSARRIARLADRLWIATDRGLVEAAEAGGPWRRAAGAVGVAATHGLAAAGGVTYAATADGLFEGRLPRPSAAVAPAAENDLPRGSLRLGEPSVQTVQRAALAYLDLAPGRMRELRRRVDRRGWLPRVDLRATGALARDRSKDFDQAFLSGGLRHLVDEELDRSHDVGVSLTFTWDLGDAVYHPDALDVSKEAREVIELRDDILDEVIQLYFERRRVLASLAALGADHGEEAARLRLRADELAAGLDAWTGGWFSRHAAPLSR